MEGRVLIMYLLIFRADVKDCLDADHASNIFPPNTKPWTTRTLPGAVDYVISLCNVIIGWGCFTLL